MSDDAQSFLLPMKKALLTVAFALCVTGAVGLGIRGQNGARYFLQRFALRPHGAYDPVAAMKLALEHQNPLVASEVLGTTSSPYPATQYSLLTLSHPAVLLWALKPHEDGIEQGLVARAWNLSSAPAGVTLTPNILGQSLASVRETTHLETDLARGFIKDGAFTSHFAAQQLKTLRFQLEPQRKP